jgi:DNA modification methylase
VSVQILQGDVRLMLATLPAESVQCVVTSPPYYSLRDYGVDGQLGLEASPAEFIAALVGVFDEVRRVMRPDACLFVNLGDSYAGSGKGPTGKNGVGDQSKRQGFTGVSPKSTLNIGPDNMSRKPIMGGGASVAGIPAKNLLLIPERFAIAMQDAGWIVRSRIAWCKTSAMPESVRDRPTSAWEVILMFTRQARYFYDADAVRQPNTSADDPRNRADYVPKRERNVGGRTDGYTSSHGAVGWNPAGANLRNYWLLGPEPSREQHYAAFPSEIPRRCILAATSERGQCPACGTPWVRVVERKHYGDWSDSDAAKRVEIGQRQDANEFKGANYYANYRPPETLGWQAGCPCDAGDPVPQFVLDPFLGSGTTALVADQLGRNAIGVELNPEYAEMARRRITNDCPMFTSVEVAG